MASEGITKLNNELLDLILCVLAEDFSGPSETKPGLAQSSQSKHTQTYIRFLNTIFEHSFCALHF